MNPTENFYLVESGAITDGPYPRPRKYGDSTSDETLAAAGHYRLWVQEVGRSPGEYYSKIIGPVTVVAGRCEQTKTWVEWSDEEKIEHLQEQTLKQIPQATVQESLNDPAIERDIVRASAAANEKLRELETADLDTFDPTLQPPPGDPTYSILSAEYTEQEPYVGTPGNKYGPRVVLQVKDGESASGDAARANVKMGATLLPSLVFAATEDPAVFDLGFPSDRLVADPNTPVEVVLLWGSGSAQVGRTLKLAALGDRESGSVRAGDW